MIAVALPRWRCGHLHPQTDLPNGGYEPNAASCCGGRQQPERPVNEYRPLAVRKCSLYVLIVPYRPCPDLVEPLPAPEDTPAMVERAAAVARGERQGAMLSRLAELGMKMAEAIVAQSAARRRLTSITTTGKAPSRTASATPPRSAMARARRPKR